MTSASPILSHSWRVLCMRIVLGIGQPILAAAQAFGLDLVQRILCQGFLRKHFSLLKTWGSCLYLFINFCFALHISNDMWRPLPAVRKEIINMTFEARKDTFVVNNSSLIVVDRRWLSLPCAPLHASSVGPQWQVWVMVDVIHRNIVTSPLSQIWDLDMVLRKVPCRIVSVKKHVACDK